MSSKNFIYQDIRNRINYSSNEFNFIIYKSFSFELQLTTNIFMEIYYKIYLKSTKRSLIRNRCIYTNRSRAVCGKTHFSRFALVKLYSGGYFPGVRKASW